MRYLVDTHRVIDGLARVPALLAWFNEYLDQGLAVSIVTLGEVWEGLSNALRQHGAPVRCHPSA
jgi:predicted nucleic acid-binding protein